MKEIPDERQIYVSARLWHEIYPKVNLPPFIYKLHDALDLEEYGSGLKRFFFTFIIVRPDDPVNKPYLHFSSKKKEVDLAVAIDYPTALQASDTELIHLMEAAYLQGIDQLATLPLTDFDVAAFRRDVEAIFSQDRWWERVEAA